MKLILHIGVEKTGTTLLQNWLYSNQGVLSKKGVFLSDLLEKNNNRKLVSYFQRQLDDWAAAKNIITEYQKKEEFKDFLKFFSDEIRIASKKHHTMVITSEHFHSRLRSTEEISELKSFLSHIFESVTVVCYFREQSQMAISLYSTVMKLWSTKTLDDFLKEVTPDNYYYNFREVGNNWSNVFDKINCNFRIYDRELFPEEDIRLDFLSILGIQWDPEISMDVKRSNEALSRLEADLYRAVNEECPFWRTNGHGIEPFNPKIKRMISSIPELRKGRIESSQSLEIFEKFLESNCEFFGEYFDGSFRFCPPSIPDIENNISFKEQNDFNKTIVDVVRNMTRMSVENLESRPIDLKSLS